MIPPNMTTKAAITPHGAGSSLFAISTAIISSAETTITAIADRIAARRNEALVFVEPYILARYPRQFGDLIDLHLTIHFS